MEIPPFSSLPAFALWFVSVYALGYLIIFKNWGRNYRAAAASYLMFVTHGTPALVLSLFAFANGLQNFCAPNTAFHNVFLNYSTAYFLADLLHYMAFATTDALFIAHHAAMLYVLVTCRYVFRHGAAAVLAILGVAEATTTCQNTWSLARFRRVDSARTASLFETVLPFFCGHYTMVRRVVAPLLVCRIIINGGGGGGGGGGGRSMSGHGRRGW